MSGLLDLLLEDSFKLHHATVLVNCDLAGEWSWDGGEIAGRWGMVIPLMSLYLFIANLRVFYLVVYVVLGFSLPVAMISSNSLTCLLFTPPRQRSLSACECLDQGCNDELVWCCTTIKTWRHMNHIIYHIIYHIMLWCCRLDFTKQWNKNQMFITGHDDLTCIVSGLKKWRKVFKLSE